VITSFDHFNMPRVVKKAWCEDAADLPDSAEVVALHLADACVGSYRSSIATVSACDNRKPEAIVNRSQQNRDSGFSALRYPVTPSLTLPFSIKE
jgi:hypothetical protein